MPRKPHRISKYLVEHLSESLDVIEYSEDIRIQVVCDRALYLSLIESILKIIDQPLDLLQWVKLHDLQHQLIPNDANIIPQIL